MYTVVMYEVLTHYEEYEYFNTYDEALEYAKDMEDDNTITSIFDNENRCVWTSSNADTMEGGEF